MSHGGCCCLAAQSTSAVAAVRAMNPDFIARALEIRVGVETENVFHDDFWDGLSGVCTALDNVDARLYVDSKCLFYRKPMLESGTLGTKGNTQVVVPHVTEHYGAARDPPEESIPVCTLKNFPNKIEHTLQWATDWFEGVFNQAPGLVNQYVSDRSFVDDIKAGKGHARVTRLEQVRLFCRHVRLCALADAACAWLHRVQIRASLTSDRPCSMKDCVTWARRQLQRLFHDDILQLLHSFPADMVTAVGTKFWSGPKRAPEAVVFDPRDETHVDFVRAAATLYARVYGLTPPTDREFYVKTAMDAEVPPFVPRVRSVGVCRTHTHTHTHARTHGGTRRASPFSLGVMPDTSPQQ